MDVGGRKGEQERESSGEMRKGRERRGAWRRETDGGGGGSIYAAPFGADFPKLSLRENSKLKVASTGHTIVQNARADYCKVATASYWFGS